MDSFVELLMKFENVKVIDASIGYEQYVPLDLSVTNPELEKMNIGNAEKFEDYINDYVTEKQAIVAFGGYNEHRNLYQRSAIFNDNLETERNIHIGMDFWIKAGTTVLAALNGKIHSFAYNTGLGNYGPTVILEHHFDGLDFYTLYGHLSLESIAELEIGQEFKKGEPIATLGEANVNGDYAPHLHFQIIRDIEYFFGDYPGVCSKTDLEFYLGNCPNPNLLLKIENI